MDIYQAKKAVKGLPNIFTETKGELLTELVDFFIRNEIFENNNLMQGVVDEVNYMNSEKDKVSHYKLAKSLLQVLVRDLDQKP